MRRYIYMTYENEAGVLTFGPQDLRILAIEGLGTPSKEYKILNYVGYDGSFTVSEKKTARAITVKFDISDIGCGQYEMSRIMRILDHGGELRIQCNTVRKKITASQVIVSEPEYHGDFRTLTVQFICDDPFFHDYDDIEKICFEVSGNIVGTEEGWSIGTEENPVVWGSAVNDRIIINDGDFKCEPIFIITASGTSQTEGGFEILKVTKYYSADDTDDTNVIQKISFNYTLSDGETVTVNLNGRDADGRYAVSDKTGSILRYRSADTSLSKFWLDCGENRIITRTFGTGTGLDINAKIRYSNNYAEAVY